MGHYQSRMPRKTSCEYVVDVWLLNQHDIQKGLRCNISY